MSLWDSYKREERKPENKVSGKMRCVIVDVEERVAKSGNPMVVVYLKPSGCRFKVRYNIVKSGDTPEEAEHNFNERAAKFFDAFPEIGDGNRNYVEWIGCEGAANFAEGSNGYLEVKGLVFPRDAESLPPFEGEKPPRMQVTKLDPEDDPEDEDLPWV